MSTGRIPIMSERSATRAERLADLTELNVATASTSVPPAVASEEIVTQSAMRPTHGTMVSGSRARTPADRPAADAAC